MRFDIDIYEPADIRAFAAFLNTIADRAEANAPTPPSAVMTGQQAIPLGDSDGGTADAAPAEAPKRRGRPKKVVEEAPVEKQDQQPEDPDQAEAAESAPEDEEDIFSLDGTAPAPATREDVVEAMRRHAAKFGLAETSKAKPKLLGSDKVGNLPDDPAVFAAAIARFDAAVAAGVPGGA